MVETETPGLHLEPSEPEITGVGSKHLSVSSGSPGDFEMSHNIWEAQPYITRLRQGGQGLSPLSI